VRAALIADASRPRLHPPGASFTCAYIAQVPRNSTTVSAPSACRFSSRVLTMGLLRLLLEAHSAFDPIMHSHTSPNATSMPAACTGMSALPRRETIHSKLKNFSKKFYNLLWMASHDAYMTGSHWLRDSFPEEVRARAECRVPGCGGLDDLHHVFTYCQSDERALVWDLARLRSRSGSLSAYSGVHCPRRRLVFRLRS
jgi:hypothetical protein